MHRKTLLLISLISVMTTGCSHIYGDRGVIKNREKDYLLAQSIPPLKIPPGYSSSTIESHYPVSDRPYPVNLPALDLTPPELNSPSK